MHVIVAACVLHNFCLMHDDFHDGYMGDDDDGDEDDDPGHHLPDGRAEQKRTHLINIVCP